jgi:hypothetical protein
MYRLILASCAERALIDQETNSLSLINILEEINVERLPAVVPGVAWVYLYEREMIDPATAQVTFVVRLDGKEIGRAEIVADFQDKVRTRVKIGIPALEITAFGFLEAELQF